MKRTFKSLLLSLLVSMVALPVAAKDTKNEKACIGCPELERSTKLKEGYVCVPKRRADDGTKIPAAKLFYREQGKSRGDAPTLVFVHGNGLSSLSWGCQQAELSKNYRTIAIDLRGFGCSEATNPQCIQYNYELFATDIHVVLKELCVKNPIMIGHSVGGAIAIFYNQRYPQELKKMVLVGASPLFVVPDSYTQPGCDPNCPSEVIPTFPTCWPYPSQTESGVEALRALAQEIGFEAVIRLVAVPIFYNEACQEELTDAKNSLVQSFLQEGEEVFFNVESNLLLADLRPLLPSINIPTLIAFGTIDITVPTGGSLFMFSQIPGASLATFDKKGHVPQATDYKRFNCVLEDFITGASAECCVCPLVKPTGPCKKGH